MSTIYEIPCVKGFMRMCNDGWLQAGTSGNGGNLTYRSDRGGRRRLPSLLRREPREWVNMGVQADNLAGEYFITTGSGKFFRNVEPDLSTASALWMINTRAKRCAIVWGLAGPAHARRPSSPAISMNHSVRKAATNGANRVIYHCHATNVIALTYILPADGP